MPMIGNILKALALYYVRKHLARQIVEAALAGAEAVSKKTETKLDDDAVAKFREDKDELIKIINQFL